MRSSFLEPSWLNQQADRIEHTLSSMAMPVRVDGGQVGHNRVRYHLTPLAGTDTEDLIDAADAVAEAIGVGEVLMADAADGLEVEVIIEPTADLRLLPLLHALGELVPLTGVIGIADEGNPLILNLRNRATWHLIATGGAGAGKSEMLRGLLVSLVLTSRRSQLQLLGIDIAGRELAVLDAMPHALTDLATDHDFAVELLEWLTEEIDRRLSLGISRPDLVLMIDDLDWIRDVGAGEGYAPLVTILQNGLEAGVHLIANALTPVPDRLRGLLRFDGVVHAETDPTEDDAGYFQFHVGRQSIGAQVAWLSVRDLNTSVNLAESGWRPSSSLMEEDES